jgi:acetylornithine deacetylase/succinyl-diaminopimelate desuccinylase-like protein
MHASIPVVAATAFACITTTVGAQNNATSAPPALRTALESIRTSNARTLDQQASICKIPAPPFKESVRAAEYKRRLEAVGLRNVRIDSVGNVIGERPGSRGDTTIVLAAHLDTVFPEGTDVAVRREGTIMRGPGISDDCRGLAVVEAVARALNDAHISTHHNVLFIGTVGEEGPGDLRGVRHLFGKELAGKINYFISVDGAGLGVTSRAVGSHRYRVTFKGPGGHSYGAFGMPNPIHALGRAIAAIADVQVPSTPKTTFNVGVIHGGTSVNSISAEGVMDVDMRSESPDALNALDTKVQAAIQAALAQENARWPQSKVRLTVSVDTTGIRPAGAQSDSAHIVRVALGAARTLGFTTSTDASSTDSNIAMSMGIPAITIDGGGSGHGAHSLGEWYDDTDRGYLGPQWALLIVTTLAGVAAK